MSLLNASADWLVAFHAWNAIVEAWYQSYDIQLLHAWYQSLLMQPILRLHSICCNEYITCCILDASIVDASNTLVTLSLIPVLYDLLLHAYWWAMMMLPPTFWLYKMLVECSMVAFILVTKIFLLHFVHELILIFWAHFFAFWIDSHFCNSVVWLVIYALLCFYIILPIFGLIFFAGRCLPCFWDSSLMEMESSLFWFKWNPNSWYFFLYIKFWTY